MGKTTLMLASMTLAVLLACIAAVLATVPGLAQSATVTLVGAGDIARCYARDDEHTAKLINNVLRDLTPDATLPALNRARVVTLGDNAYFNGTRAVRQLLRQLSSLRRYALRFLPPGLVESIQGADYAYAWQPRIPQLDGPHFEIETLLRLLRCEKRLQAAGSTGTIAWIDEGQGLLRLQPRKLAHSGLKQQLLLCELLKQLCPGPMASQQPC